MEALIEFLGHYHQSRATMPCVLHLWCVFSVLDAGIPVVEVPSRSVDHMTCAPGIMVLA